MAPNHFMLVVNAVNIAKDYGWIAAQIKQAGEAAAVDSSSRYALIAHPGPARSEVLQPLTAIELGDLKYYWFAHGEVANARATISRTGYTGEDGFEIFVPPNMADRVWQAILESGRAADVIPCGLGARDTLRLEAAMRLYGNDIDETDDGARSRTWVDCRLEEEQLHRRTTAARAEGKGPDAKARRIRDDRSRHRASRLSGRASATSRVGVVTSGTQTPFLKKAIGMAYVPTELATPGAELIVDVRGRASARTRRPTSVLQTEDVAAERDVSAGL